MGEMLRRIVSPDSSQTDLDVVSSLVWHSVSDALEKSELPESLIAKFDQFEANVERQGRNEFYTLLRETAEKNSWSDLLVDDVFRNKPVSPTESSYPTSALVDSWNATFRGSAAKVLLMTVSTYLDKRRDVYARYTSMVNSSGTGKSRMVDEVATKIVTIPMCLREEGSIGFPPADKILRDWLKTMSNNIDDVHKNFRGLLAAVFSVTKKRLETIESKRADIPSSQDVNDQSSTLERQELLAAEFRRKMSDGQSFYSTNKYRQDFFQDVVNEASDFAKNSQRRKEGGNPASPRYLRKNTSVNCVAQELTKFIDPLNLLDASEGPRRPLILLAFDEGHFLAHGPEDEKWTLFSELQRALRIFVDLPIFSLFLSTSTKFRSLSPEIRSDPSRRVVEYQLKCLYPITEISFDDLVFPAIEDTISLEDVVSTNWICHLGRPLFGSHYDAEMKEQEDEVGLMDFAKVKLLDGPKKLETRNEAGALACLSVRFGLDINFSDISGREVAQKQVERHMRLYLAATSGFEKLVTTAGSEPYLAEAAQELMYRSGIDPVKHLASNSSLTCVDRGERGELVAALIIMRARDAAALSEGQRDISVNDFLEALLPTDHYNTFKSSGPYTCRRVGENRPLSEAFEGWRIWFNHVIKVQASEMIETVHLWKFLTRGAMVMCMDGQRGVDIVIPICEKQTRLSRNNITAILVQVKNNKAFKDKINITTFDNMDPSIIFQDDTPPLPVIRMVFALASDTAKVHSPEVGERTKRRQSSFTTYDIWCAGLSPHTFRDIGPNLESYRILLVRSCQPHDGFEIRDEYDDNLTIEAREEQRRRIAPLSATPDSHNSVHVNDQ